MRVISIGILLALPAVAAGVGNRAVQEANYEVGAGYQNSDLGDTYSVGGRFTAPVLGSGGVSLNGSYDRLEGDGGTLDSDAYLAGVDAFVRDYDVGRLSAGLVYRRQRFDRPRNAIGVDRSLTAKTYRVAGEFYAGSLTLGASRSYADLDRADDVKLWNLAAREYLKRSTRLGASLTQLDGKVNYALGVANQPQFWHNAAQVFAGYADIGDGEQVWSLALTYFFDKRPALMDRDRKYR